jgi:hypothetical protein
MMKRRLVEELKELEENIQVIRDLYSKGQPGQYHHPALEYEAIYNILYELLSAPDKSFEVVFQGVEYDFIYPTTWYEKESMDSQKDFLIKQILQECDKQMLDGKDPWWMVTAFASGVDTLDMQIEIVKEEIVNRVDEKGERITALPLDMDNYQIEMQRPEIDNGMD